jgi:hypothetical protein
VTIGVATTMAQASAHSQGRTSGGTMPATLAARLADLDGAIAAFSGPIRFTVLGQ